MATPFIPIYNTARVEIGCTLNGLYFQHGQYWYQFGANWQAPELLTLASACGTYYINNILPLLSSDVTLLKVTATRMDDESVPPVTIPYSSFTGGIASRSLPNHQCMYLTPNVLRRKGDSYFHIIQSGIPISVVTGNYVDKGWINDLAIAWIVMLDILTPFFADWVQVRLKKNGEYLSEGQINEWSTIYKPDTRIGVRSKRARSRIR